jgi:hypothetical protein
MTGETSGFKVHSEPVIIRLWPFGIASGDGFNVGLSAHSMNETEHCSFCLSICKKEELEFYDTVACCRHCMEDLRKENAG